MRPAWTKPRVLCITFDGVIVRADEAMLVAARAACEPLRLAVTPAHLALGYPIRALLRALADEQHTIILPSEIERARAIFEERYASGIRASGSSLVDQRISALIADIRERIPDIKVVLASPRLRNITAIVNEIGIAADEITSTEAAAHQGGRKKRSVDETVSVFTRTITQSRVQPKDCLGIARYPHDIALMRDADMCAASIRTDANSSEILDRAGAWRIFASVEAMSAFALVDMFRAGPPTHRNRERRNGFHIVEDSA